MLECKTFGENIKGAVIDFPLHVWREAPQVDTTEHLHSFVEIVLIYRGHSEHYYDKKKKFIKQGDAFIIPPGVAHLYKNSSEDFSLINIIFLMDRLPIPLIDISLLPGFDNIRHCRKSASGELPFVHLEGDDYEQMKALAERLCDEDKERTPGYRFAMLGTLMTLIVNLSRIFSHTQDNSPQVFLYVSGVISYLNCHFRKDCSLAKLCHIAGMSRATLQRKFQLATGTSPRQYQIQLRIAEATTMLRSSDKTIDDIAAELGFGNRNYFSRQFHKIVGCSPLQFRKDNHPFQKIIK